MAEPLLSLFLFISYAYADQVPVKRMIADLEKQGIRVWVDSEGLRPGTPDWEEAVRKAICTAKAVIFVASPEARSSPYVKDELNFARRHQHPVFPIWVTGEMWIDCIPLGWGGTQYIDARGTQYEIAIIQLLRVLTSSPEELEQMSVSITQYSRRQELQDMLTTTSKKLISAVKDEILLPREILTQYAVGIETCWSLFYEGGQSETERMLPLYRSKVSALVDVLIEKQSGLQKIAAGLASQSCQLACLLASQRGRFQAALYRGKKAFEYANLVNNANLQIASLIRHSIIYWYLKQPQQYLEVAQKGLIFAKKAPPEKVSPLLYGKVSGMVAEAHAWLGQKKEALNHNGLALDIYPSDLYEYDLSFIYTHFDYFSLHENVGLMHFRLDNPSEAWNEFKNIEQHTSINLLPRRVELLSRQAEIALALDDLDLSCTSLKNAVMLANEMNFQQVCSDENLAIYRQMQVRWPYERKVKTLAECLQ